MGLKQHTITTMEPLLSHYARQKISNWKYKVDDESLSTKCLTPVWNFFLENTVPLDVAPNVLTISGLLCLLYAWYLSHTYLDNYPTTITLISIFLIYAYQTFDALDGKQARRTKNNTPFGELFDHVCDNIGVVFLMLTLTNVLGITNTLTVWFLINIVQINFMTEHVQALHTDIIHFGYLTGPGEAIIMATFVMLLDTVVDITDLLNGSVFYILTLMVYGISVGRLINHIKILSDGRDVTRFRLLLSLVIRFVPVIFIMYGVGHGKQITLLQLVADGMIMSIMTTEVIIAKMGNKCPHPWLPLMMGLSHFDNVITIGIVIAYHLYLLAEIANYLNIFVFTINKNVYMDGVFDMFHKGHFNAIYNALKYGNRLIVGVVSDKDVEEYKRKPFMTFEERCQFVNLLEPVHKVIQSAPLTGITRDFIKEHNIHHVVYSEEYDNPENPLYDYYEIVRQLNIGTTIPRTDGISTSDIIKRVQDRI